MQLIGSQFTNASAIVGNDISTLPDFPAEIRAPAGSLPGVSGFQVAFSNHDILTPGDQPDVLVVMNPAALKVNLPDLAEDGIIIANTDEFKKSNLNKAGYENDPLEDGSLAGYRVVKIPITTLTLNALEDSELPTKTKQRCKNTFALGVLYWLYDRPLDSTIDFYTSYFGKKNPEIADANVKVLKTGYNYSNTTEIFTTALPRAEGGTPTGHLPETHGERGRVDGLIAGFPRCRTAAVLRELSHHAGQRYPSESLRAQEIRREDVPGGGRDRSHGRQRSVRPIAGSISRSTGTSGPGVALKSEAIGPRGNDRACRW